MDTYFSYRWEQWLACLVDYNCDIAGPSQIFKELWYSCFDSLHVCYRQTYSPVTVSGIVTFPRA